MKLSFIKLFDLKLPKMKEKLSSVDIDKVEEYFNKK